MIAKHQILSNEDFVAKLGLIRTSAKQVWELVSLMALDAVLKYHQHSYDTSRCKALDDCLDEAGLGTHQAAFRRVLNTATGVMIGTWKNSAQKLANQPEPWEDVVARLEGLGLDAFRPDKKEKSTVSPIKQDKAKTTVKVESEAVRNATQKLIDELQALPEEVQIERLRQAASAKPALGLDLLPEGEVRTKAEEYILKLAEVCEAGRPGDAVKSLDAGIKAMGRHIQSSISKTVTELRQAAG